MIELRTEADKLDAEFAQLTELLESPKARKKLIDAELKQTAKLFDGAEFDRRTVLDFDATPVSGGSADDGTAGAQAQPDLAAGPPRGAAPTATASCCPAGLGWAVWTDGRIKFTTGAGLPTKIRDVPVAPDITGLLRSGVLPDGAHLALVTRRGKVLRIDPSAVNPQGAAGNGVAGVRLAEDGDEVIAALPITGADTEAILSMSEKGWKVTACTDIPVKGRGGGGVGFHPFVTGEDTLLSVTVSPTGFRRGAKAVRAEHALEGDRERHPGRRHPRRLSCGRKPGCSNTQIQLREPCNPEIWTAARF